MKIMAMAWQKRWRKAASVKRNQQRTWRKRRKKRRGGRMGWEDGALLPSSPCHALHFCTHTAHLCPCPHFCSTTAFFCLSHLHLSSIISNIPPSHLGHSSATPNQTTATSPLPPSLPFLPFLCLPLPREWQKPWSGKVLFVSFFIFAWNTHPPLISVSPL